MAGEALVAPLDFTSLRNAVTEFEQHRDEHAWQIELNRRRTLSVNGVSDALVSEGSLPWSREKNESLDKRDYRCTGSWLLAATGAQHLVDG